MSFVAAGGISPAGDRIANNGFWPDLHPADFRDAARIGSTIPATRVAHALNAAVIDVNRQLREWMERQVRIGFASADEVPAPAWQPSNFVIALYTRAVYALAKANLTERYRDYDSTATGHDRADALAAEIDDYRRDAAWAIADLQGETRITAELI